MVRANALSSVLELLANLLDARIGWNYSCYRLDTEIMQRRATIYFPPEDQDLLDWVNKQGGDINGNESKLLRDALECYRQNLRIFGPNWQQVLANLEFNEADAIIRAKGTELE